MIFKTNKPIQKVLTNLQGIFPAMLATMDNIQNLTSITKQ